MSWLIACAGSTAGAAHACVLARAARCGPSVATTLARLGLAVGFLLWAAVLGRPLIGVFAWASGFLLSAVMLWRRWR